MYHFLRERECGTISQSLEDALSERWTSLQPDPNRSFELSCLRKISFVQIASPSGLLLLCGGVDYAAHGDEASIGIYRYPQSSDYQNKSSSSTQTSKSSLLLFSKQFKSDVTHMCGTWFPNDPAVFLTTGHEDGDVLVWDTERCAVAVRFRSLVRRINNMRMSTAPGARSELVAVSHSESRDVTLLDLNSGSFAHRLEGNFTQVYDLCWSPTHPHLLATVDIRGVVYLFDVRRSGKVACLLETDENREMPDFKSIRRPSKPKRFKNESDRANEYRLGLGCGWRQHGLKYRAKKRRIDNTLIDTTIISPTVRFTSDGTSIISSRRDHEFQVWDVHTGRLVNRSIVPRIANYTGNEATRFEVCRDNMHIIFATCNTISAVDFENGNRVYYHANNFERQWNDIAIHPLEEELCTFGPSSNRLTIWSPNRNQ